MTSLLQLPLLQHLGQTLLHSLWEITLLALVAKAGLDLLRRRTAAQRHAWAFACHVAMGVAPLATFLLLAQDPTTQAPVLGAALVAEPLVAASRSSWHLPASVPALAALVWMTGTLAMTLRLVGGLAWTHRIRTQALEAPATLVDDVARLSRWLGLAHLPQVGVLAHLDSPLVVGWWKPMLLIPAGALIQLPPAALEAVLAHELAHLARRDAWTALVQSVLDTLLHFHPAAWWLSRHLRVLREEAADDLAVTLSGDPTSLAEGLALLALLRRARPVVPEPALAAAKGPVLARIQRLLHPGMPAPAAPWGLVLVAAAVLSLPLAVAQEARNRHLPAPSPSLVPAPASAPAPVPAPAPAMVPIQDKGPATPPIRTFDFTQMKVRFAPPPPPYPELARLARVQGTVVLDITVDERGVPTRIDPLDGPEPLRDSAIAFARQWRFVPAEVNGKAVPAHFRLQMPFKLQGKSAPPESEASLKVLERPSSSYPAAARALGIQGTVLVEVTVDEQGHPRQAKALEGPEQLRAHATEYVMGWRFAAPGPGKGPTTFTVTLPYRLK